MNAVQNRTWLGALGATIWTLCKLLIDVMSVANNGVAMADKAVRVARRKQTIDLAADIEDYEYQAEQKAVLRKVKSDMAIAEFIGGDAQRQQLIDSARTKVSSAIKAELALLDAESGMQE